MKPSTAFIGAAVLGCGLAQAQTFVAPGPALLAYDMFLISRDGGQGGVVTPTNTILQGVFGAAEDTDVSVTAATTFTGTSRVHSVMNSYTWNATNTPGSVVTQGGFDSQLDNVDSLAISYHNYLRNLSATDTFGDVRNDFSYTSTGSLNVLDFDSIILEADSGDSFFELNGGASGNDVFVIRVTEGSNGGDLAFVEDNNGFGIDLILNNIDFRNVYWWMEQNGEIRLNQNGQGFFGGNIFSLSDGDAEEVALGDVDFDGRVFARSIRLGSDLDFTGATIPESSSAIFTIAGLGAFLLRRRRR